MFTDLSISFVIYKVCLQIYQVSDVCEILKTFILSAISLNVSVVLMKDRNWRKFRNLWDPNSLSDRVKTFWFPFSHYCKFYFFQKSFMCVLTKTSNICRVILAEIENKWRKTWAVFKKNIFQQSSTK